MSPPRDKSHSFLSKQERKNSSLDESRRSQSPDSKKTGYLGVETASVGRQSSHLGASKKNPSTAEAASKQTNVSTIDIRRKAREKQYESIKDYAIKYNVDEAMIYSLLSEYKGLLKFDHANDPKLRGVGERKTVDSELLIVEPSAKDQADESHSQALISISTFLHFSVFKRLLHHDVFLRILQAFGNPSLTELSLGVDVNGKHAYISQQQYIGVNCFLRIGSLPKQMIIEIWIKVRPRDSEPHDCRSLTPKAWGFCLRISTWTF